MGLSFSALVRKEIRANLLRDHAESFQTFRFLQLSGDATGATIISNWHVDLLFMFARHVYVNPNSAEEFSISSSWSTPDNAIVGADDFSQVRNNIVLDICVNYGYENTVDGIAFVKNNVAYQDEKTRRLRAHIKKTRVIIDAYKRAEKEQQTQLAETEQQTQLAETEQQTQLAETEQQTQLAEKEQQTQLTPPLETIADDAIRLGDIDWKKQITLSSIAIENTLHKALKIRKAMKGHTHFRNSEMLLKTKKDFVTYVVTNFYAALTDLMEESVENEKFMYVAYEYIPIRRPIKQPPLDY